MARIVPSLYWRLGAENGLVDRSGNGRDGTAVGNVLVGGEVGAIFTDADEATAFDGTDDKITSAYSTRRQLCTNPRAGAGATTGWQVSGASTIEARSDITGHGLGFDTGFEATTVAGGDGVRHDVAVTSGRTYRFSLYARLSSNTATGIRFRVLDAGGNVKATGTTYSTLSEWVRLDLSVVVDATATWRFRLDQVGAGATVYRFTAVLIEEGDVGPLADYFDGSYPEAGWLGTAHASASDQGVFANGTVRTFEGWAWRDVAGVAHALIGTGGGGTAGIRLTAADEVSFKALDAGASTLWANAWPGIERWVHWVVIFDEPADTVSLYVNGRLVSSQANSDQWGLDVGVFQVGMQGSAAAPFDGKLDEIAVYASALTPAEILAHYKAGAPGITAGATPTRAKLRVVAVEDGGSGQGHDLTDRISGLRFSNIKNGGDESCNFVLHERWGTSVPEIAKGNLARVMDGLDVLWQGRIEEHDRGGEADEQIAVTAYGGGIALKDSTFREVFIDQDQSRWTEPSTQRRLNLHNGGTTKHQDGGGPASDPETGLPAVVTSITGQWTDRTRNEQWYVGEIPLALAYYSKRRLAPGVMNTADVNWTAQIAFTDDDVASAEEGSGDLNIDDEAGTFSATGEERTCAYIYIEYDITGGDEGTDHPLAWTIALYGRHGLTRQGDEPGGFTADQVIANIAGRVSDVTLRRLQPTAFVIRHLVYIEHVAHEEGIAEANRFDSHQRTWGTWGPDGVLDGLGEAFFDYTALEPDTQHWVASRADCDDVSLQSESSSLYNTVHVTYTDEGGVSRTVTRTRHVPELGTKTRAKTLHAGKMVTEAAEALGDAFLALYGAFAPARGQVQLSRPIRHHTRGELAPHYMRADGSNLRVPDVLPSETLFELDSDPDRRTTFPIQRVNVDASGSKIQVSVEVDQTNDVLSALLARTEQSTELIAA